MKWVEKGGQGEMLTKLQMEVVVVVLPAALGFLRRRAGWCEVCCLRL
jgi:hypothetical protein